MPLHRIRVGSPRPNTPLSPSSRKTSLTASPAGVNAHVLDAENEIHTVRDFGIVDLAVRLDDAEGVRNRVGDDGGGEANECQAEEPEEELALWRFTDSVAQSIVLQSQQLTKRVRRDYRRKPRVMANKGGGGGRKGSPPQCAEAVIAYTLS